METNNRQTQGIITASLISVIGNGLLAIAKLLVGWLSSSIAVVSDGIDSTADVAISVVMLVTAHIMKRPPNEHYVYGYLKAETLATKILSFLIFYAGLQMFTASIQSILSPTSPQLPEMAAIYVTAVSVVAKLGLALYQTVMGRRYNSAMLRANGVNMRNDVLISLSVLVGLIFTFVLKLPLLDAVTALLVSLFILKSAIELFFESNVELMDGVKDSTIYTQIFAAVERVDGAHNPHKVRSRTIGTRYAIVLDIEVDDSLTVREAHEIATHVEQEIRNTLPEVFDIVVHVEPLGVAHEREAFGMDASRLSK